MATMNVKDAWKLKTYDSGLFCDREEHAYKKEETLMIVFSEDKAKDELLYLIERSFFFDPMLYNRRVIESGRGVNWTSEDPKQDGLYFRLWYEKCQIVLLE